MKVWVVLGILILMAGCTSGPDVTEAPTATETPVVTDAPIEEAELLLVNLPGSQPNEVGTFKEIDNCEICHADYGNGSAYNIWRGSMMANSLRDPLFWALVAIQNKVMEEKGVAIGDYCLRCHSPTGWLEGRSEPADGSGFEGNDYNGVQCDFCHRMVDPLSDEGKALVSEPVETHRNGQFVVTLDTTTKFGPYDDSISPAHETEYSEFYKSSEFCATCHEILNPFYNNEVVVEKTYTEWEYSAYNDEGKECQDCHQPITSGYGCTTNAAKKKQYRDDLHSHEFVGGNAWAPLAIIEFDETLKEDLRSDWVSQLKVTVELAKQQLARAAELDVTAQGDTLSVKVTNIAGHKLPTGFTEGRRMWINVRFLDSSGKIIKESGAYNLDTAELTTDSEIKVYEAKPGMKDVEGYPDGESFQFALNNVMVKDNRIPPRGFTNAEFEANGAYIVGGTYEDGQHWDITDYTIPGGAVKADVTLKYQTSSKEFIEFLRDENVDNKFDVKEAGAKIYGIWEKTGKSAPVDMATATIEL